MSVLTCFRSAGSSAAVKRKPKWRRRFKCGQCNSIHWYQRIPVSCCKCKHNRFTVELVDAAGAVVQQTNTTVAKGEECSLL